MHALQIGEPAPGTEHRGTVAFGTRGSTRHRHDRVGTELTRQPHRPAQRRVVIVGDRLVGMQRVAPYVQGVQLDAVVFECAQPRLSSRRIGEQLVGIQMGVRGITTGTDLDGSDLWHLGTQPGQRLLEGLVEEGLEHYRNVTLLH